MNRYLFNLDGEKIMSKQMKFGFDCEIVNGFVLIHNKKDSTVVFVDRFSDRKVI